MEFVLMTEPHLGGSFDDLVELAEFARRAGMAGFARSDHYYSERRPTPPATDAYVTLAAIATRVPEIRLAVLVSPITFRHPAVMAKSAASLDEISGGRFDLGVGTGWYRFEHDAFGLPFPPWEERFARLEETLAYLRAAFAGGRATFQGRYYRLDAEPLPRPTGLRIVVGGRGPLRTPRLAGTYADEYNHFVAPSDEIAPKVERMRRAALEAGRSVPAVSVMGTVLAGLDRGSYRKRLQEWADERSVSAEHLEERLRNAGVPAGTPDRLAETFAELKAVGVSRYYLQWLDLQDRSGLEETWEAVSQAVRALD
jgi:alkanesulfonate monooxygenase SsuD/methylene tetrahydromethanopterin reductase-like flavin-dependent oxidoreductase (luciferase family)